MKSIVIVIIAIILVLFSCENRPCVNPINEACQFPERPDNLTNDQWIKRLNLSEETLGCITTKGLVETCLNYPELRLFWTRNSFQLGYDYLKTIFNGFAELENRSDAGGKLLKAYSRYLPSDILNFTTPIEQGKFTFTLIYYEILMSQKPILNSLKSSDAQILITKLLSNFYSIQSLPAYSLLNQQSIAFLLGRLLEAQAYQEFINKKLNDQSLNSFLESSAGGTTEIISSIIASSEEFLTLK